jgi:hypothetical protein
VAITVAADTAAWIGAIAGTVAAVAAIAALWGVFRWFKPTFRARVDARRQAIRLDVVNDGRAGGWVNEVAVIGRDAGELNATFFDLEGGDFRRGDIPPHSRWHLIIRAPRGNPFPADAAVLVKWGRRGTRTLIPEATTGTSYYGEKLKSQWP